ncbi:unnamed protein product, partial [Scytosiphon promiscuus]
ADSEAAAQAEAAGDDGPPLLVLADGCAEGGLSGGAVVRRESMAGVKASLRERRATFFQLSDSFRAKGQKQEARTSTTAATAPADRKGLEAKIRFASSRVPPGARRSSLGEARWGGAVCLSKCASREGKEVFEVTASGQLGLVTLTTSSSSSSSSMVSSPAAPSSPLTPAAAAAAAALGSGNMSWRAATPAGQGDDELPIIAVAAADAAADVTDEHPAAVAVPEAAAAREDEAVSFAEEASAGGGEEQPFVDTDDDADDDATDEADESFLASSTAAAAVAVTAEMTEVGAARALAAGECADFQPFGTDSSTEGELSDIGSVEGEAGVAGGKTPSVEEKNEAAAAVDAEGTEEGTPFAEVTAATTGSSLLSGPSTPPAAARGSAAVSSLERASGEEKDVPDAADAGQAAAVATTTPSTPSTPSP